MTHPQLEVATLTEADVYRATAQISRAFIDLPAGAVDDKMQEAIGQVAELVGADRVTVTQLSLDGKSGRRTHQWRRPGIAQMPGDDSFSPFPWVTGRVVRERGVVVISRLDELPPDATRDRESFQEFAIKSLAVYPLVVGGSVIGMLSFAALTREHEWPTLVRDGLQLVSEIVGSALARKRAHLRLQEALAFEHLIAELSATFIALPPERFDDQVHLLLARVADVLELDRVNVVQRGLDDGRLDVTHQWVREGFPPMPSVAIGQDVPWVLSRLLDGKAVIFSSPDELPPEAAQDREHVERHGPKAAAVLPMTVTGLVVGAISFGCLSREHDWDADTLGRLRLVTQIVGSALARKRADLALRAALEDNERLRRRLEAENAYLQAEVKSAGDYEEIAGRSPAICAVLHKVDQVAATDVPVLLLGETGTGKELIARALHAGSARNTRPLIAVNCAALPPSLIESELFGHEKGAFTGATQSRAGRFELADGGTLFLDEIGDLEPALQGKLLRTLQGGEIERLGSSRTHKVDVRVIAATNRDLGAAMSEGRFRADLYYRLSVFPIEVPPLRERREDIPMLVWHFIQSRQRELGRLVTDIPKAAMDALVAYDWPGNVRELQNIIDRALILTTGSTLRGGTWCAGPRSRRRKAGGGRARSHRRRPGALWLGHPGPRPGRGAPRPASQHVAQPNAQARHPAPRAGLSARAQGRRRLRMRIEGATLRADLIAGTTVFTVLVPSAMAYGQLAGVTPEAGMYAGLVAMLVYAILGSSRHLIVGPEATSALLAAMIVGPIAGTGAEPERFAYLAAALAALVGAILIAGGLVRIGFLADFLPRAVLTGYITGAALLVIQSQLGKLFRVKLESDGFFRSLVELDTRLGETHVPTLLLGIATIAVLLVLRRFVPKAPSSLVVLAAGIALSAVFGWQDHGINIVGEVTAGLPSLGLPRVSLADVNALLPGAASMALLAFSDAVLTGRSFAARHGYAINANRELIALGAANLGTALAGAFPVAASGSRTAVNDGTGAKSKLSGAIAAVMMIVFLLFLTPVLVSLPLVVLGAIIIVSSLGMIEIGELVRMYRFRWETFAGAIVTLVGVVVVGIVPGILIAVTMSLFLLIAIIARPSDVHLVRDGGSLEFRPIGVGPLAQVEPGLAVYRLNGLLMFANCGRMKSRVAELIEKSGATVRALILDLEMSSTIDLTALTAIEELHDELSKRGVRLMVVELNPAVRELFRRAGTDQKLGADNTHTDIASAIRSFHPTEHT